MISIIIPVYNTNQYLLSLYESLKKQTYSDLEIIFVNDGSTDESQKTLEMIASDDNRIRILQQTNQGVSAARNHGFEISTGEFISFIDSDDTLEPDMYEYLLMLMEDYHVDIAHCSYNRIIGSLVKPIGNTGAVYYQTPEEALECLIEGKLFVGSCWNKLYSRHLFKNIRFNPAYKVSEDMLINFQLFSKAIGSAYGDTCKYNYLSSETSSCIRTPSLRKAHDRVAIARQIKDENQYAELIESIDQWQLSQLFSYYKALRYERKENKKELQITAAQIAELRDKGYRLSQKNQISYMLLRHAPFIYKILYDGIYDKIRVPNYDV